ncbi:MAG TPA: FtsX-like permease family protein [Acidimicrobiales bacterium]
MLRVTLRGLLSHKIRFVLTTFAVVVGVGFVVGTLVLTDSVRSQFNLLFTDINSGIDLQVKGVDQFDQGAFGQSPPIPETLLPQIRALPGVKTAGANAGGIPATVFGADGKPVVPTGGPPLAVTWDPQSPNGALTTVLGGPPKADDEVALDVDVAQKAGKTVGDEVTIQTPKGPGQYKVVGTVSFGSGNALAGATLVAFTLPEAQRLYNLEGKLQSIDVAVASGTSVDQVQTEIEAILPAEARVVSQQQVVSDSQKGVSGIVDIFGNVLLGFAGVTLFVSAFLISNTFNIVVGQRVKELALLRAIGAGPGQIFRSVLGEALVVGVLASILGTVLGIGIALGLQAILSASGFGTSGTSLVFTVSPFIAAVVIGLGVTLVSALLPAWKATTVPPVAGLRDGFAFRSMSMRLRGTIGAVVVAVGGFAVAWALFGKPDTVPLLFAMIGGALLIFLGVAMLSPAVAAPVAHGLGLGLRPFGSAAHLAEENAARNPRRTASTASALMIGLALITLAFVVGTSLKQSFNNTVNNTIKADWYLSTGSFYGFDPAVAQKLKALPELATVASGRQGLVQVDGSTKQMAAIDFATVDQMFNIGLQQGSLTGGQPGVLVGKDPARDLHLAVGDPVTLTFNDTGTVTVPVVGIYGESGVLGNWVVDLDTFAAQTTSQLDNWAAAKTAPGVSPADARAAMEEVLKPYPDLKLQDRAEYTASLLGQVNTLLVVVNVFLFLAILIAVIGIVNTLALSVFERTRELGLLRAVGMSRRQLRRMVRVEAVIVAVFGALLGVAVGLVFGIAVTSALPKNVISGVTIPFGTIIVLLVLAAVVGVIAAIWPARRASRLNILDAIANE